MFPCQRGRMCRPHNWKGPPVGKVLQLMNRGRDSHQCRDCMWWLLTQRTFLRCTRRSRLPHCCRCQQTLARTRDMKLRRFVNSAQARRHHTRCQDRCQCQQALHCSPCTPWSQRMRSCRLRRGHMAWSDHCRSRPHPQHTRCMRWQPLEQTLPQCNSDMDRCYQLDCWQCRVRILCTP